MQATLEGSVTVPAWVPAPNTPARGWGTNLLPQASKGGAGLSTILGGVFRESKGFSSDEQLGDLRWSTGKWVRPDFRPSPVRTQADPNTVGEGRARLTRE